MLASSTHFREAIKKTTLIFIVLFTTLLAFSKIQAAPCCFCQPWDTLYCPPENPKYRHEVASPSCTVSNPCCEAGAECNKACQPIMYKPCCAHRRPPCKKGRKHFKRTARATKIVEEAIYCPFCTEPRKTFGVCPPLPKEIIVCKNIFPGDLVEMESTCTEFQKNLLTCTPSTCTTPYVQDPSKSTKWEIHGKKGNRCIISNTSFDIGLKDGNENPIVVTQQCEYDRNGINALLKRFYDMGNQYYHFTTCERGIGMHNCAITSGTVPIQSVRKFWY